MTTPTQPLSAVALTMLNKAPLRFRSGGACSCRQFAMLTGYSFRQCQRGLVELADKGYAERKLYAANGRFQYAGNPDVLLIPFVPQFAPRTRRKSA